MEQIVIRGGRELRGTVRVNGAKNAALPIMAACLLVDGPVTLDRVPRLRDVETMAGILRALGVAVEWIGPQRLRLCCEERQEVVAPFDLVRRMRGSVCTLGPLVATRGAAVVALPGGCVLGERPIDLHVKGLAALGAEFRLEGTCLRASAGRLRGKRVDMTGPRGSTCLGTANVLMAAALAEGCTVVEGAAREPEIQDLARFLNACGARIEGIGTPTLTVRGVERLRGTDYVIIPDRIEAGTFLAAAAATGGRITLEGAQPQALRATIEALRRMGVAIAGTEGCLSAESRPPLRPTALVTGPYPELATDMQPQLSVLLCLATGTSSVEERVYTERFTHVGELIKMGACVLQGGARAVIEGVPALRGAEVRAADLRAGGALVLAGLAAEGTTTVTGVDQIDRGYQDLEAALASLGADIRRAQADEAPAEMRRRTA
ncbi:MAG: hypothetical protein AMK73_02110 [Planctomycetes bacterium SM23_32]|nr:MAG: hypothetical protein AMK73_02110 [Planctomycetes bacterium SM23_32]